MLNAKYFDAGGSSWARIPFFGSCPWKFSTGELRDFRHSQGCQFLLHASSGNFILHPEHSKTMTLKFLISAWGISIMFTQIIAWKLLVDNFNKILFYYVLIKIKIKIEVAYQFGPFYFLWSLETLLSIEVSDGILMQSLGLGVLESAEARVCIHFNKAS